MSDSYLVTGGMGFIGSFVVEALVAAGHRVTVYDKKPTDNSFSLSMDQAVLKQVNVLAGDVLDQDQLLAALKKYDVTGVVHLAAVLTAESSVDPVPAVAVNCVGLANVLEAARTLGLSRVVWASSIAVYGFDHYTPETRVPNGAAHNPDDIYGACKSFGEHLTDIYWRDFGVHSIGLRFVHGTGVGRQRGGGVWARELIDKPALGQQSALPHADELENWLSVEDQASAVVAATRCDSYIEAPTVTIAGFDIQPRRAAAAMVSSWLPDAQIALEPGRLGRPVNYDISAAHQLLDWAPTADMAVTLRSMINRVRRKGGLPEV